MGNTSSEFPSVAIMSPLSTRNTRLSISNYWLGVICTRIKFTLLIHCRLIAEGLLKNWKEAQCVNPPILSFTLELIWKIINFTIIWKLTIIRNNSAKFESPSSIIVNSSVISTDRRTWLNWLIILRMINNVYTCWGLRSIQRGVTYA